MKTLLQVAIALALFDTSMASPCRSPALDDGYTRPFFKSKTGSAHRRIDPNLPPVTGQSINAEVNAELAARFAEAAGTSSGLLTQQQAKNASWGYVADHFAAIDRDHDGYITFGDVLDFMHGGSAKPKSVQIVE